MPDAGAMLGATSSRLSRRIGKIVRRLLVSQIDQLFELEADDKRMGYNLEQRLEVRTSRSASLLESTRAQIQTARHSALPKSSLAKVCDYTLTLRSRLIRFLRSPTLELSNNGQRMLSGQLLSAEKNWPHIGSEEGSRLP
jgi:hypothetical protein